MRESPYRVAIVIMGGLLLFLLLSMISCGRAERPAADADEASPDTVAVSEDDALSDDAFATPEAPVADDDAAATDETADIPDDTVLLDAEEDLDDAGTAEDDLPAVDEAADEDAAVDQEPLPFNACGINRDGMKANGAWNDPIVAPYLPLVDRNTTGDGVAEVNAYSCGGFTPVQAGGREKVYAVSFAEAGMVAIELDTAGSLKVFLLDAAANCVAQSDTAIEREVAPGEYTVVVDGSGDAPYTLAVEHFAPDRWSDVELAPGLHWMRLRTPELLDTVSPDTYAALIEPHLAAGHDRHTYGMQTINVLTIDPAYYAAGDLSTLRVAPVVLDPGLLGLVSEKGSALGALAAVNASFFNIDRCPPESNEEPCRAVHLFKADGTVYSHNTSAHRAIGWNEGDLPEFTVIEANADWPEKGHAVGIISPLINEEVVPLFGDEDNLPNQFKIDNPLTSEAEKTRHPRTVMALADDGTILIMTFDGRTGRGDGMYMYQLAHYLRYEWLAVDAVNLDGGGSSTMWVEGCSVNGIVNYPADLRKEFSQVFDPDCTAPHHHREWERAVADGIFVFQE